MGPSARGSRELVVVLCCACAAVLHQATHWSWTIEDAAICYAYARNAVAGLGLVPSPGGERVEAVSDPSWVALLTLLQAFGLDGWTTAKPLGMLCGAATTFVVWRTALRALPGRPGAALVAPVALALNAQLAIWSASGLENGLFNLLLAGAIHRAVVESEAGGAPWSALLYLLLAWTRPEGIAYGMLGFALIAAAVVAARRAGEARGAGQLATWAAVVAAPLALSEALRIWYFAWPLPNPFYAKVVHHALGPLDWGSRGWLQLREWSARLWHAWLAPVYVLGLTGTSGWRPRAGAGVVVLAALAVLAPDAVASPRVVLLVVAGAVIPLAALATPGGRARALCGASVWFGLLFHVVADGDWMGAYRFTSNVAAPLSVLTAAGFAALADVATRLARADAAGTATLALGTALLVPPNLDQTRDHLLYNHDVTPQIIKRRVDWLRDVSRRTFWDGPLSNLDIDQGAFLWWAPDFTQYDLGMLVEIPMARHDFQQRAFVRERYFEEARPTFANVGDWWIDFTGLRRYPEWQAAYFETPGYPTPDGGRFPGVFARRELVMDPAPVATPARRVGFDWNLALTGLSVPVPWTAGRRGYFEAPFSVSVARTPDQQITEYAFLARDGRVVASWPLDPGYGLLPMDRWRPGEVFRGRYAVPLPKELPPGRYDLGFLLLGPRGRVVPALDVPAEATAADPIFARGEVRFPGAVEVVGPDALADRIAALRSRVLADAGSGACEAAEDGWVLLKRHRPQDWTWQEEERPPIVRGIADCWAERADGDPDPAELLARAHRWDFASPALERVGDPVAERLLSVGDAARARSDWETAYHAYSDVLGFQPWRSWARRYAEEARDHRLGLVGHVRVGNGGEADLRAAEEGRLP